MTTVRTLVVAVLLAPPAAAPRRRPFASRCRRPTGLVADDINITVFDRNGRVVDAADLGGSSRLPGDVVVMLSAGAGEARAFAVATVGGSIVGSAVGRVPVVPGQEMPLGLQLVAGQLPDSDGDGVPDVIDNCPNTPNPDQASASGDNVGDACRCGDGSGSDGGVVGGAPGGDSDMGGVVGGGGGDGGLVPPAGCGDGVVGAGEQCDQGPNNSDDPASASTCTTMCKSRASCGTVSGASGAKIDPLTGHCYVAWPGPITFASAERDCQSRGGYLAVVTAAAENSIVSSIGGLAQLWIGLEVTHATTDSFHWVDSEPYLYMSFAPGEPNNGALNGDRPEDCIARTSTGWADLPCGFPATGALPSSPSFALGFACESSCGNGIVDPGEECDGGSTCTANCFTKRTCTESGGVVSPVNGHCYFVQHGLVDFSHALSSSCPSGTHLATPADLAEEEAALQAVVGDGNDAWICAQGDLAARLLQLAGAVDGGVQLAPLPRLRRHGAQRRLGAQLRAHGRRLRLEGRALQQQLRQPVRARIATRDRAARIPSSCSAATCG